MEFHIKLDFNDVLKLVAIKNSDNSFDDSTLEKFIKDEILAFISENYERLYESKNSIKEAIDG